MPRFRKKPVVIDAIQWDGTRESAESIRAVFGADVLVPRDGDSWALLCKTLEGRLVATPQDWIIRGIKGEVYPCKPDVFAATYEAA